MVDTERDRVVRELRRVGRRGDAMYRAAEWLDNNPGAVVQDNLGNVLQPESQGFRDLADAARKAGKIPGERQPPPDNTIRDMLTQKTISLIDEERARHVAAQEGEQDQDYIQWLTDVRSGEYRHVAKLIALTARFAGELPHDLISHHARRQIKAKVEQSDYVRYEDQIEQVEVAIWELVHQKQFPPLIGNANNAAANYVLRNKLDVMMKSFAQFVIDNSWLSQFLMFMQIKSLGEPKFKKRSYDTFSFDHSAIENIIDISGNLMQLLDKQLEDNQNSLVSVLETWVPQIKPYGKSAYEFVASFVLYLVNILNVIKKTLSAVPAASSQIANYISALLSWLKDFLYVSVPIVGTITVGAIAYELPDETTAFLNSLPGKIDSLFSKIDLSNVQKKLSSFTPTSLIKVAKMILGYAALHAIMPDSQAVMSWLYRSPHFNIEFREHLLTVLSNHFDTFSAFKRRKKDAWTVLVDPGLAGNARMACYDLSSRVPRLRNLTMTHVLTTAMNDEDEHNNMFTDYFCGAVAARWRANSVFSAQPYKTRNEQNAVVQALADASVRLRDYAIQDNRVVFMPRKQPKTLTELRSGLIQSPFL